MKIHQNLWSTQDLISSEIEIVGRLIDASNATLFGTARLSIFSGSANSEAKSISIVYKPIAGERPLWDFPDGNLASREVASYLVSEFLGLRLIPTTVLRDGPFGPGAVQQWIEVDQSIDLLSFGRSDSLQIRSMAFLDILINNTDRKFGHILVDDSGNLFGCDHGVTFHVDSKLRTVLWQFSGQPLTGEEIERLKLILNSQPILKNKLEPYLTLVEIAAFFQRASDLLGSGSLPYPSEAWPPVPWPPV